MFWDPNIADYVEFAKLAMIFFLYWSSSFTPDPRSGSWCSCNALLDFFYLQESLPRIPLSFLFSLKVPKAYVNKKQQLMHDVFNECEDPNGENNYIRRISQEKTIANI